MDDQQRIQAKAYLFTKWLEAVPTLETPYQGEQVLRERQERADRIAAAIDGLAPQQEDERP